MATTNTSWVILRPVSCPPEYSLAGHEAEAKALVGINIFTSFLGILGNLLVCVAVFTSQGMTSSFHYFISSLAAADLTIALVDQPLFVVLIFGRMSSECFPAVDFAFRLVGNFACAVSLLTLALIAIDRCLFGSPRFTHYKNTMTMGKKIALGIVWVLAAVYSALRLSINKEVTSYLTTAVFGLCYVDMIVCYAVVYYHVFKQRQFLAHSRLHNTRTDTAEEIKAQTEKNATERRFARTIVMVLFVFTTGWFLLFYLRLTQPEKNYGLMYNTARTVALSASAINPALYCFNNKEYRRAFKRILSSFFLGSLKNRRGKYERIK